MGVGKNLKELLANRRMTIKQLAQATGIEASTLYGITQRDSDTIRFEIADKIARTLGLSTIEASRVFGTKTIKNVGNKCERLKVYISGPMTSLPEQEVERTFRIGSMEVSMMGHYPVNPHVISGLPFEYEQFMRVDLEMLNCCEGIYMLRGWEHSSGARRELMMARAKGLMVMYQELEMDKDDE